MSYSSVWKVTAGQGAADLSQQAKHNLRPVPSPVAKLQGRGTYVLHHSRKVIVVVGTVCWTLLSLINPLGRQTA